MPVKVRARRSSESGKPFKIVNARTGKVEGESDTRADAEASARARNASKSKGRKKDYKTAEEEIVEEIRKAAKNRTSAAGKGPHTHRAAVGRTPGTYLTSKDSGHVHLVIVTGNLAPGQKITSTKGSDGHTHTITV